MEENTILRTTSIYRLEMGLYHGQINSAMNKFLPIRFHLKAKISIEIAGSSEIMI